MCIRDSDVNYLNDIKENFQNCLLIGDRGYISKEIQMDLFNYSRINLSVPMRKNQHNFVEFSRTKSKIRKRIELRSNREFHGKKIK